MVGSAAGAVKANATLFVMLACVTVASGCFWRRYPERMRTHAELLTSFARKANDLVATGRFTAQGLPELTYPFERATMFAADARRRTATPPASLVAFESLLERYRHLLYSVDRTRVVGAAKDGVADAVGDVEAAARVVQAALDSETG